MTDKIPIMSVRLTRGRYIFDSLPRLSDVRITVVTTFGKVLCYYFVEVSAWHHTRKLPYWCGGCQSSEIKKQNHIYSLNPDIRFHYPV